MELRKLARIIMVVVLGCVTVGCGQTRATHNVGPVPFSHYRAGGFYWPSVRRVVILPLWNESSDPRAADEIRQVLGAELQSIGPFEVLAAPIEAPSEWSRQVRVSGRFDELELVELAQAFHADALLCGAVTHYHAYAPPRVGLSLRLISTFDSVVIASVDGLWDARNQAVAEEARSYYGQAVTTSQATSSDDVILSSPHLFQKYVCAQVSRAMVGAATVGTPVKRIMPVGDEAALP